MDEVVTVNLKDEVTGTMARDEAHKNSVPHRIAVVYVENEIGEILIQIRKNGRYDHSSAGHVNPGEEYIETAKRDLSEELGIFVTELISIGKGKSEETTPENEHIVHFFEVFVCTGEPGMLNPDEVSGVFWAKPRAIHDEMNKDPYNLKFTGGFKESIHVYLKYKGL